MSGGYERGGMSGVALVRNPKSTRNLKSASGPQVSVPAEVRMIDCDSLDGLTDGLVAAHSAGAGLILINGGDGTVREVLSRLPEISPAGRTVWDRRRTSSV